MNHSGREDRKLSEVKAVLQRLQGLSTEPESTGLRSTKRRLAPLHWIGGGIIAAAAAVLAVAYTFPSLRQSASSNATSEPAGMSQKAATKAKAAVARDAPVAQAGAKTRRGPAGDTVLAVPGPGSQPAQPKVPATGSSNRAKTSEVRPALEAALALMTSGRVQAARQRLLAMGADGSPDVAWALARSYDPNYLGTIPAADARPDIVEATRWYRTWYAAAVKQGLVADSVSLERIIGSMQP
jgi:hypothetical protein